MVSGRGSDAARRRATEALTARRQAQGWRCVTLWLRPATAAAVVAEANRQGISITAAATAALARGCGVSADSDDDK